MGRLDGKIAIITGASQGMGEAHARHFVAEGAKVVMTDINDEAGEKIAAELGENAHFVRADAASLADWQRVVAEAEATFGPVSVLINNAGIIGPIAGTVDFDEADYLHVCAVNQHSQFYGMKSVVPSMQRAGGGSIVNVSSIAGIVSIVGSPNIAYVGSKFASRGMTKHAAIEYGKQGIRANAICPGFIETPMSGGKGAAERFPALVGGSALKRAGQPEEVAELASFLASDRAAYITGAIIPIDGGSTACLPS